MNRAIFLEPFDVETRLEVLGLNSGQLHRAISYGEQHRSACTPFDPPCLPGIVAWGKTVRGLRETLSPHGWISSDEHNFSIVIDPTNTMAIAVATGDEGTGNRSLVPKTKYPKGPATIAAVEQNLSQIAFDFIEQKPKTTTTYTSDCVTWILLISRNNTEIRCELSLPNRVSDEGYVVDWQERILLPPISIDTMPELNTYEEEGVDDIVVEISRRNT